MTRTEAVELAHIAKAAELVYWEEFEKIYGGWTIEWDPQSDARLEGLALKMRTAEDTFWQAKSELDPGDPCWTRAAGDLERDGLRPYSARTPTRD